MHAIFQKSFKKAYKKFDENMKLATDSKIKLFYFDPFDILLNNHALTGKYKGCRSINITGDIRAIYKQFDERTAIFIALGSHSELYR